MTAIHIILASAVVATVQAVTCGVAAADVHFRIRDRLAADEVAEVTTFYVDGQQVGAFKLDADNREIVMPVSVPDDGTHEFGMCGHILVREPGGLIRKKAFDISGTIADVADRDFEAVASENFTRFYLIDTTVGRPPAPITTREEHACAPAVS